MKQKPSAVHALPRAPRYGLRRAVALTVTALIATLVPLVATQLRADAYVFPASTEVTYKEYWIPHSQFTAGCTASTVPVFYSEPGPCSKTMSFTLPDDFSNALKTELYVDLWRAGRVAGPAARFSINGGVLRTATVGNQFSRSPYVVELPKSTFNQGSNTITFSASPSDARYHIHDVVVRVYHDATHPLVAASGGDVTPPTASLFDVGGIAAATGGNLNVNTDKVTLRATASGAAYVDFLGYYEGYDEDVDGLTLDWHGQYRNNWGPGGLTPKASGATIDHLGTATTATGGYYTITWNLPDVPNQSNVRFKIRAVDAAGNVREAPGGISAGFNLTRSVATEVYRIPAFADTALHHGGDMPDKVDQTITLPDLANVQSALLVGQYWANPFVSVNGNTAFKAFNSTCETCGEDSWQLSKRVVPVTQLVPGTNTLTYSYNPNQNIFGAFVEKPGPMILLKRAAGSGAPSIVSQPASRTVPAGSPVSFTANAKGASPLAYQWQRNGADIPGATGSSFSLTAVTAADNMATFRVVVSNGVGAITSASATLTVAGAGEWWDQRWEYRVPILANPSAWSRADAIVETPIDFTAAFTAAGAHVSLDPGSIRVVEVDTTGTVVDDTVTHQFVPDVAFEPLDNAKGTLIVLAEGAWAANVTKIFHVYFDTPAASITPVTPTALVSVTTSSDEGQETFRVDTPTATYQYQKQGGSLSSLVDQAGNDWLSYNASAGAAGQFRGMPNFPYPEGHFHPGFTSSVTELVSSGPLRVVVKSTSTDGKWSYTTSFYPRHAVSRVTKIDAAHKYWFLYEGTPGGAVDSGDIVVRSTGAQTAIGSSWSGDIVGDEWAYVGDPAQSRSIFLASNDDDGFVDSYFLLDGKMTVLGLGRTNVGGVAKQLINEAGKAYTFGLIDTTAFATAKPLVNGRYKPITVTVGQGQRDLGPVLTPQVNGLSVIPTATGATVTWSTASATTGVVEYGPTDTYGSQVADTVRRTSHTLTISGLACATDHHLRLSITDTADRTTTTPDATFRTSACAPLPVFVGDDFSPGALNTDLWTVVDPVGGGSVTTNGSQAEISFPGGSNRDAWGSGNRSVRAMQPVSGVGDAIYEAKFESIPRLNSTFTGLLFEESPTKWVRADFTWTANALRVFAASVTGTTATARVNSTIGVQLGPLWLRVQRAGSTWTVSWSNDGTNFTATTPFTFAMAPTVAGVFAGSTASPATSSPTFTSTVDYVVDTAAPIAPEDGADATAPSISGVGLTASADSVAVTWATDEATTSTLSSGPDATYGTATAGPEVGRHLQTITGLTCGTAVHFKIAVADRSGNTAETGDMTAFAAACATRVESDEFNAPTLKPTWKVFSPVGDVPPTLLTGTNAVFDLPAASKHDLVSPFNAHRLLQYSPDTDLQLESKWETLPYAQFQSEGMIVQAGPKDFVRFEAYHNGSQLRLYAATVVGGVATQRLDTAIGAIGGITLRVVRSGDQWTLSYQPLGGSLLQAVQFNHTLVVNNVGVHVINSNTNVANTPTFAASLDYFRTLRDPQPVDDTDTTAPVISNVAVETFTAHAVVSWTTDEPASSRVDYGADATYGANTTSANRVLRHSLILTPLSCGTDYHYAVTATDPAGQATVTPDAVLTTAVCPAIQSDGFNSTTLNGQWRYVDPKGDVPGPVLTGTAVGFDLPAGSRHDLWQARLEAPRLLQRAPNTDFQIVGKWTTAPTENTQAEGMLVMQDPTNFVRFDIYNDGTTTRAFAATFFNGAPTTRLNTAITAAPAYQQRITRTGDTFAVAYSPDGVNWSNLASFSYTLGVNDVGIFASNTNATGSPPAFQPRLTAFDNTDSPSPPDDTTPPVVSDVTVTRSGAGAAVMWTTDEPASTKVEYGTTSSYGFIAQNAALVTSHSLDIGPLTCDTSYSYRVTSVDAFENAAVGANATFTLPCPAGVQSDAFMGSTLDPRWTYINPVGDVPAPVMTGTDVRFDLPARSSHDQWTNARRAVQLVQSAPDGDFEVEAKWNSPVTSQYQFEGIVVRADDTNLIRFDVLRAGSTSTRGFSASFVNGTATQRLNVATTITSPVWQRVTRTGNTWTFKISSNGSTWTTIGAFTHALAVTQVGVLAGNHHATTSSVPAFSASLDYFHNTASPLADDTSAPTGQIQNDDFSGPFDPSRWTFVDPRNGDATLTQSGGEAVISLPGGSTHDHDAFESTLTVPRIEQQVADTDFETEVKFNTGPSLDRPNQTEGLLVRQSDSKWARFDITTVNDHFQVYAATWDGANFVERVRKFARGGSNFLLRVRRVGDTWTYSYAYDDQHWTHAITFNFAMTVATVGPFFGNVPPTGQSFTNTPAFTGRVDYVVNRAVPFTQDDGVPYPPTPAAPQIGIWYGDEQTFGRVGKPQQWVNVVGNVSDFDGVSSLTYSLNGGAALPLTIGETDNRLASPGDFNAEIDYSSLAPGANSIVFTATDTMGNVATKTVTVNNSYTGQAWPTTYSIDWSTVTNVNDVAQVADGLWQLNGSTVRTGTTGYDRTIVVGDNAWDSYEAVVDVTIHSLHPRDNGAGLVAGWRGATTDNYGSPNPQQPRLGHPFPALGWYSKEVGRLQRLNIYRNLAPQYETRLAEHPTFQLSLGIAYSMKFRVEPIDATTSQYSLKVWETGTTEPTQFQLTTTSARLGGALLLGAHRADVSFGNLAVTSITPPPPDTTAPVIAGVAAGVSGSGVAVTWTTDEPATSRVDYGITTSYGSFQQDTTLVTSHSVQLASVACETTYHYSVTSTDAAGNSSVSPDGTFSIPCPAAAQSDAFGGSTIDPRWTYLNPAGDVPAPVMTGTDVRFDLPAASSHDLWTGANRAVQLVQSVPDGDFEVEAKWNSPVTSPYQFEGIVVRADDGNLVRFDVLRASSTSTRSFSASFVNGTATQRLNVATTITSPIWQRVTRTGNTWTFKISSNGSTWTTIGAFTHALAVTQVGVLAGNHHATTSSVPAFSASLDYFHNTASPLADD